MIVSVKTEIKMTTIEIEKTKDREKIRTEEIKDRTIPTPTKMIIMVRYKNSNKGNGQRKKWLYPDKFYGSTPLNLFLNSVESSASYNDWDD